MGKIMILNGSPRAPKSNSKNYSEIFMKYSRMQCDYFNITKSNHLKLIAEMEKYSDVIIVFPLYADSLPVGLLNFLKNLENNLPAQRPVISILINCGFLEHEQNCVAVSMIRYFCRHNNFPIGSTLMLGSGEAILETPFRYIAVRAIKRLSESVNKGNYKDISATMPLPKLLFKMAARSYWISYGKKFGVSEKEMQRPEIESR